MDYSLHALQQSLNLKSFPFCCDTFFFTYCSPQMFCIRLYWTVDVWFLWFGKNGSLAFGPVFIHLSPAIQISLLFFTEDCLLSDQSAFKFLWGVLYFIVTPSLSTIVMMLFLNGSLWGIVGVLLNALCHLSHCGPFCLKWHLAEWTWLWTLSRAKILSWHFKVKLEIAISNFLQYNLRLQIWFHHTNLL